MRRLVSLETTTTGTSFSRPRTESATPRIWLSSSCPFSSGGRRDTPSPPNATRRIPPCSSGTPSERLPDSRSRSMYLDTVRAFRPSMLRSFLKWSSSSITVMGTITRLSLNRKIALGSCSRTLVSSTKFLIIRSPAAAASLPDFREFLLRLLGRLRPGVLRRDELEEDAGVLPVVQGEERQPLLVHGIRRLVPGGVFVHHVLECEDGVLVILLRVVRLASPVQGVGQQLVAGVLRGERGEGLAPLPGIPPLHLADRVLVHLLGAFPLGPGVARRGGRRNRGAGELRELLLHSRHPLVEFPDPLRVAARLLGRLVELVLAVRDPLHLPPCLVHLRRGGEHVGLDPVEVVVQVRVVFPQGLDVALVGRTRPRRGRNRSALLRRLERRHILLHGDHLVLEPFEGAGVGDRAPHRRRDSCQEKGVSRETPAHVHRVTSLRHEMGAAVPRPRLFGVARIQRPLLPEADRRQDPLRNPQRHEVVPHGDGASLPEGQVVF